MLHVIASQTLKWFNPVALLHIVSSEESHCWTSLSKSTQSTFFFPHLLVYLNVLHSPFYAVASVMQSTAWGRGRLCVTVWEKKNSWSFVWRTRLLFFCIRTIHTLDSKNNCGTKHKKSEVCFWLLDEKRKGFTNLNVNQLSPWKCTSRELPPGREHLSQPHQWTANENYQELQPGTGTHLHCEAPAFAKSCDLTNILPQCFSSYEVWMWTPARVTTVCLKATMAAPREVSVAADVEYISVEVEQNVALGPFSISKRLIYIESAFPFPWKGKHILLDLT